jgi:tetratricopeptide (TPR) repeat protein
MPSPHELYDQADRLKEEGQLPEAAAKLEELLALDADYALGHSALAVVLGKLGRHEEAIEHAQRVCQLEPDDPFSFTALSVTCQRAFAGTGNHGYIQLAEEAMARSRMIQGGY